MPKPYLAAGSLPIILTHVSIPPEKPTSTGLSRPAITSCNHNRSFDYHGAYCFVHTFLSGPCQRNSTFREWNSVSL